MTVGRGLSLLCSAFAIPLVAAFSGESALAATYRVDDSATIPQDGSVTLRWSRPGPRTRAAMSEIQGSTMVQVRLNLKPWVNRTARLYIVLPEQPATPVSASWTTQGRLLAGQVVPGQRTLVYSGSITQDRLDETLALQIRADGTRMTASQRLNFHFEIDVD